MSRVCSRPGCPEPATATFRYSPTELTVWIGDLSAMNDRQFGHDLCTVHAATMSVPRGWTLEDGRTPRPDQARFETSTPMLARAFRAVQAS